MEAGWLFKVTPSVSWQHNLVVGLGALLVNRINIREEELGTEYDLEDTLEPGFILGSSAWLPLHFCFPDLVWPHSGAALAWKHAGKGLWEI